MTVEFSRYPLVDVLKEVESVRMKLEKETGATIEVNPIQHEQNTNPTPMDSPIVVRLKAALKQLRGLDTKAIGIGGGTVGLYFRRKGIQTAVWSTLDDKAHQPNEYCKIENMVNDESVPSRRHSVIQYGAFQTRPALFNSTIATPSDLHSVARLCRRAVGPSDYVLRILPRAAARWPTLLGLVWKRTCGHDAPR